MYFDSWSLNKCAIVNFYYHTSSLGMTPCPGINVLS